MDANIVSWIITGVVGLILLSSVFWGMKRGLKKSLFRFVWILVTAVVLYFVTPLVSNAVNNIDLTSYNINVMGPVTNLSDVGVNIFASFVGREQLESNADLLSFAQNVSTVVLNVLLFVLLFWIARFLLWIIWAPIAHKNFDKKQIERKKFKKEQKKKKKEASGIDVPEEEMPLLLSVNENKHRWWGALVGFVIGCIIVACTFVPIVGINNIYQNVYANVLYEDEVTGEEKSYLDDFVDEDVRAYINSYQNSIASKVINYTGVGSVSNYVFKNMAAVNVGKEKFYFEEAITSGVKVYNKALVLMKLNPDNLSQKDISDAVQAIKDIFYEISKVRGVYVLADSVLPQIVKTTLDNEEISFGPEEVSSYVVDVIKTYDELNLKSLQSQVNAVLNIVQELNSKDLIVPVIYNNDIDFEFVCNLIDDNIGNVETFTDNIFDNLYKIDFFEDEYPRIIDKGFEAIFDSLGIEYVRQTSDEEAFSPAKIESVKNGFKTIFKNAINFIKLYANSVDFDFDPVESAGSENVLAANSYGVEDRDRSENTGAALDCLGNVLNVIRVDRTRVVDGEIVTDDEWMNFLSETNYANLIDFAKTKLRDIANETVDISSVIDSIDSIGNWKEELSNFRSLYRAIIHIVNSEQNFDELLSEENPLLDDLGYGISNVVSNSKLINNKNIREIFEELLKKEEFTSSLGDILTITVEGTTTVKDEMLNNIFKNVSSTVSTSNVGTNWENEIKCFKRLLSINFGEISFDVDEDVEDGVEKTNFGKILDDATKSKIFTKTVANAIIYNKFDDCINALKGSGTLEVEIENALNGIKQNISNIQSYEVEFANISDMVKTINVSTVDLEAVGRVLDEIKSKTQIITADIIEDLITHYFDDKTDEFGDGYASVISQMNAKLAQVFDSNNNTISYEVLFGELSSISSAVSTYGSLGDDNDLIVQAGAFLDEMANMSLISDKTVAKSVANVFVDSIKDYYASAEVSTRIDNILADNNFGDYAEDTEAGQAIDYESYFANLFAVIVDEL